MASDSKPGGLKPAPSEDFEGDIAIKPGIAGTKHLPHAPFANLRGDFVDAETGTGDLRTPDEKALAEILEFEYLRDRKPLGVGIYVKHLTSGRLPHFIDHPVGHKTGDSSPSDANDVGIIYSPSGPIVVAVFANDLGGMYREQEDRIGRIARVIVDYFEGRH